MVKGRATVGGGGGKVVKVTIELGHVIRRGRSSTSGGMGGRRRSDSIGSHCKIGRAKLVTTMGGRSEFPLHCTMEGDKLEFPSRPSLGRGDKTVPRWAVVG